MKHSIAWRGLAAGLVAMGLVGQLGAYTPGSSNPTAIDGFVVNTSDRRDVLVFYNCAYQASADYAAKMAWTGNVAACLPGTTASAYKDDVRRRVNFFRAMCGLPADITFDATKAAKCQEAALMMSANNSLNHFPPTNWLCYTANGAEAAGASNLAFGNDGPAAVDAYMEDSGSNNAAVGHRRWIVYSRAQEMATGDIPFVNGSNSATNSLWVIGNFKAAPAAQFVTWPNAGFVPDRLSPARWSLSYPGANFASASVVMTQGGAPVTTVIISNAAGGIGDSTLVWEPAGLPTSVTGDVSYDVTVSGISGAGVPASYSYTVTLFNPDMLGDSVTISGTNTPPTTGQSYTFNGIDQADGYEVRVSTGSTALWIEGAEDAPAPHIVEGISPGYTLRQSALRRTGSKAFQLTYPSGVFDDQSFIVTRDVLPSASSQLQFFDRARFSVTTTTMDAQVSTDNGTTWATVFSRNGVGLNSGLWDANWISRSISLASYAGQVIRLRFIMKSNGGFVTQGVDANFGFFIDDITVTNATELVNATNTALAGASTSFTLNASSAGAALVAGTDYYMQVRPNVGCRFYGYGALKIVTAQALTGFAAWIATNYPAVTGSAMDDHEFDGIRNGIEYAFDLNPLAVDPASSLPQPMVSGGNYVLSYSEPFGVTGVTYGAEWSENLTDWNDITDTGSGGSHVFSVSIGIKTTLFIRHKIVVAP
ncbi:MAG: hypothetical protein KDK97_02620 [Verrucomicrobiales bacterium]|nr:hypothetical protein [Verrucomicrobiales bacterium]MCP5557485.1 hypothetical protein [Verrucomicrobiaceae bacterium]